MISLPLLDYKISYIGEETMEKYKQLRELIEQDLISGEELIINGITLTELKIILEGIENPMAKDLADERVVKLVLMKKDSQIDPITGVYLD